MNTHAALPVASTAAPAEPDAAADVPVVAAGGRRAWVGHGAGLAVILLIGLAVRAWLVATPGVGYEDDLRLFTAWTRNLADNGLARFYATQRFCDYPPLGVLGFYGVGLTGKALFGAALSDEVLRFLLKVPACLADLGIALLLYLEGRRLLGRWAGTAAAALFFLNPVTLYNSAYWGQVDAIYTFFALLALVLVARRHWLWAGAAVSAGLLAKFQTIAFVPLLVFEAYRLGGWRAITGKVTAAIVLAILITLPFTWTGTLNDVLQRSYVNVVGQYNNLSKGAFNIWSLVAPADTIDTSVPGPLTRVAAHGRLEFPAESSWLLWLTWRRISLIVYAVSVAVILSIYSLRPGPIARYEAAALLGLAFFLFPTEMHERYSFPVLAFLALWAVSSAWRERIFFLLSTMLLLNLAFVLSPGQLAPQIAAATLLLFGVLLIALARPSAAGRLREPAIPLASAGEPAVRSRPLIVWFRRGTLAAVVLLAVATGAAGVVATQARATDSPGEVVFLSDLKPNLVRQTWRSLMLDQSVAGGPLQLGQTIYARGLGTHAPSRIEYLAPPGAESFQALAGIDYDTGGPGTAIAAVEVDGRTVFASGLLTWKSQPVAVKVAVKGGERVVLRSDPTPDGQRSDHVDWALARFQLAPNAAPVAIEQSRRTPETQPQTGPPSFLDALQEVLPAKSTPDAGSGR